MKRFLFALLVTLIIVSSSSLLLAAEELYNLGNEYLYYAYINDTFYNTYHDFNLIDYQLRLPQELSFFSPEVQDELLNLAALYANRTIRIDQEFNLIADQESQWEDIISIDKPEGGVAADSLVLTPLPGVLVNADFKQEQEDLTIEENTNISLQYWMNNRTLIRAEYDLASKKWWDIKEITLDEDTVDDNSELAGDDPLTEDAEDTFEDEGEDRDLRQEVIFNKETSEKSRLGISYKTSDRITITADYLDEGEGDSSSDFSTILGLEYTDQQGLLRYRYQIDFDEMDFGTIKKMESGVKFGISDLAIINASYQLLNPTLLEDQLKESIWDFGLDLNLNDISSLSLGYQLKSNPDYDLELEDKVEKEANIKAQLEIRF